MTRDAQFVEAFLVADDLLRHRPPCTGPNTPILADPRMPVGFVALGSPNGAIVVKEIG